MTEEHIITYQQENPWVNRKKKRSKMEEKDFPYSV